VLAVTDYNEIDQNDFKLKRGIVLPLLFFRVMKTG